MKISEMILWIIVIINTIIQILFLRKYCKENSTKFIYFSFDRLMWSKRIIGICIHYFNRGRVISFPWINIKNYEERDHKLFMNLSYAMGGGGCSICSTEDVSVLAKRYKIKF